MGFVALFSLSVPLSNSTHTKSLQPVTGMEVGNVLLLFLLSGPNRVPIPDLIRTIHLLNPRVPEIVESSPVDLCNLVSDIILSYALGQALKCPWASVSITVRKDWSEYVSFCLRTSNNLWFLIQLWIFQHSDYSIYSVTTIHSLITELL